MARRVGAPARGTLVARALRRPRRPPGTRVASRRAVHRPARRRRRLATSDRTYDARAAPPDRTGGRRRLAQPSRPEPTALAGRADRRRSGAVRSHRRTRVAALGVRSRVNGAVRVLVTGGAGFIGSHLVDALVA